MESRTSRAGQKATTIASGLLLVGLAASFFACPAAGEQTRPPHESKGDITTIVYNVANWYEENGLGDEHGFGEAIWASPHDYYTLVKQLMVEIGNHETYLGTISNTYNEGVNYGWAQFDKPTPAAPDVVFIVVVKRLKGESLYSDKWDMDEEEMKAWAAERLANIRDNWEPAIREELKTTGGAARMGINADDWTFDPEQMDIRLLEYSDTLSAIFLREAIDEHRRGLGNDIPNTVEGRAEWWLDNYNFAKPKDRSEKYANYMSLNTLKDGNGIQWVYAGMAGGKQSYYAKSWESNGGPKSYLYMEDNWPVTYACLGAPKVPRGAIGDGKCVWVTYCDSAYSLMEADYLANSLRGSSEYTRGAIGIAMTDETLSEPSGYISRSSGDYEGYQCGTVTRIDVMYPGCDTFAGNAINDMGSALSPGYCAVVSNDLPTAVIAAVTTEPGPIRLAQLEPLGDPDNNAVSSTSDFQTHLTVYLARLQKAFKCSGIAYQVLPSGLAMAKPVNMTLLHEGKRFSHGDGIFAYRFEDPEIWASCNITVLSEKSAEIDAEGGTLRLGDMTVTFPGGSLANRTAITIRELMLECANETNVTGATGANISINETDGSGSGRQRVGPDYVLLAMLGLVAILAVILAARALRAKAGGEA